MQSPFFIPQRIIPESHDSDFVFPFYEGKIALAQEDHRILRRSEITGAPVDRDEFFGLMNGTPCFAQEWDFEKAGYTWIPLRQAFEILDEDLILWAGRGKQILQWLEHHQFCGRCGHPTEELERDWGVRCPNCSLVRYPRINPAVIVAITRETPAGPEVILVKKKESLSGFHSLIAGFVETGESLEEAVRRESLEEIGIELEDIRYWGSQSWPFPDALMVGFTAKYKSGELKPDGEEISLAGWFNRERLPTTPPRFSIASKILSGIFELFIEENEGGQKGQQPGDKDHE
jgi:NAD+ diphosphatase